ncbi:hydroxymethylpyrimidine/phosphomethylpyrimidine kinase [Companilactobacillus sp. RD055328]|uniref:bifunctional hydroxymethylpyrimidine kinase/phosphomethylpyrimidine kinase n=1 Tax=Companilactobacillus sp. RD055328 TaxID=2916634 RepID=UPI001FC7D03C|nr:bifunctional hydroxymethylpyrimidine kinase/phosphomethylpyrimidine kinase [Companilactobacillus sp. RD055328]GKQ43426.1 hydroxymethylpyrimidine/phosphomethylpyrimidine kinase [Companilactobacillus sp. RD055328]
MISYPQVLTIAGSDCDGSAGAQADLKTFMARDTYGMSVLTAAVAGNSYQISASHVMPVEFINAQCAALAEDFTISAFKTGMLADTATIESVVENIQKYDFGFFVLDPVIITKHGNMLLEESAYQTLVNQLLPLADMITPNFFEAQKLADMKITNDEDMLIAAKKLQAMGVKNVLLKGSHNDDSQTEVRDLLLLENGETTWLSEGYIKTDRVNGTGDTLAACIVSEIAKGNSIADSVATAKKFTHAAIKNEIAVGHKFGPINHFVKL